MNKLFLFAFFVLTSGCTQKDWLPTVKSTEPFLGALHTLNEVILHDVFSPPVASRILAYSSIAAYEASIAGQNNFVSLEGQLNDLKDIPKPNPDQPISQEIAGFTAYIETAKKLVFSPAMIDAYANKVYQRYQLAGVPKDLLSHSRKYGEKVALHILEWSKSDQYKQTRSAPKYTLVTGNPSRWIPTPPMYKEALEPHWEKIRPFAIDSAAQFKLLPFPTYSKDKSSAFYKDLMEMYEIGKQLTDEQKAIALFWDDNAFALQVHGHAMFGVKKVTPGGHSMNIAAITVRQKKLSVVQTTETFARVAIAIADGFITCWQGKYATNRVRPETVINREYDEKWVPFLQTPPFPEYPSGHSTISRAAAEVLTFLHGDNMAFQDTSNVRYGNKARSFASFRAAANEASISRVYGGIHYRTGTTGGEDLGRQVGEWHNRKLKTLK
ncbi:MAG TPA: phosphatidic acid phosphatase [Bacteroidetes bacterium]|nr:phosphatidic acid phosphatase [Bacteroidota bacterium]HRR07172.1 vanadium-dependent haloperoxidase [Rhodothermales bacterium]